MLVSNDKLKTLLKYEGVIFDLDGTLVNSMPLHIKAWQRLAEELNICLDEQWLYDHGGVPSYKIASLVIDMFNLQNQDSHRLAALKTKYYVENIATVEVFPAMLEVLNFLKENNKPMSIGTGTLRSNAEFILHNTVLRFYIKEIVSADDVQRHKPFPDTFLEAARRLGVNPMNSVVFEDTKLGIEAAKRGNFNSILVENGMPLIE